MKKILVTGAAGQIGSELVLALRERYGNDNVIAAGNNRPLPESIRESGPFIESVNVLKYDQIEKAIKDNEIDTIFHMSSILSALGEEKPDLAFEVNFIGHKNVLDAAKNNGVKLVIAPSSIAAFGNNTPKDNTPNDTLQRPSTMYGISKVWGELIGQYYFDKYGLDVRGVRFPGLISWKTEPTAGTTDYAVEIFYEAIKKGRYTSFLSQDTRLPMMYMPDAIKALIDLAEADGSKLEHRTDFNVAAMSFTPTELAAAIKEIIPEFEIDFNVDPIKQKIADSWPNSLDDSVAKKEWNWKPSFNIKTMTKEMLENLKEKLKPEMVQNI